MSYSPPAYNAVLFNIASSGQPYTPPAYNAVFFDLSQSDDSTNVTQTTSFLVALMEQD